MILIRRQSLLAVLLWAVISVAGAADTDNADQLFSAGLALQKQAEAATVPAEIRHAAEGAIEKYRRVAQLRPDFAMAHGLWAACLLKLAGADDKPEQRMEHVRAAVDQFTAATRCPDIEWQLCQRWGATLATAAERLATSPDLARAVYDEVRRAFELALKLAPFNNQRADIERGLGECLAHLADIAADSGEQRTLFRQAAARFETVAKADASKLPASSYAWWGLGLLQLAKLEHEPQLLPLAVDQLKAATALNAELPVVYYNLACCFAMMRQPTEALRQLRLCLAHDADRQFLKLTKDEKDLESLRGLPEFARLLAQYENGISPAAAIREGLVFQRTAEAKFAGPEATNDLAKAIARYRQAAEMQPDYYSAHLFWAQCLHGTARHTVDPEKFRELIRAAQDQYRLAADCPGADSSLLQEWAGMLATEVDRLAPTAAAQRGVMVEAARLYERGVALAKSDTERAPFERNIGSTLVFQADRAANVADKISLYTQAAARFMTASKLTGPKGDAGSFATWGLALLQLGKLNHDKFKLREAVERLQTSVDQDPARPDVRFNLACCYALLSQPGLALQQLRACLEHDPDQVYRKLLNREDDLKSLWQLTGFQELAAKESGPEPVPSVAPRLKEK